MDIPRIFNIMDSAHRIHNPFTPEKFATLGAALHLESSTRILDLGSGSGEMLCTWARDYGVIGTGVDISQNCSVSRLYFVTNNCAWTVKSSSSMTMRQAMSRTKRSMCWPAWVQHGSVGGAGTIELLARSLSTGGIILIGEPYWRQLPLTKDIARDCLANAISAFLVLPELVALFGRLGYDVVELVLANQDGWDRYEAAKWLTMRRWLEANPDDELAQEVQSKLASEPERHAAYTREYLGWGVFALMPRTFLKQA